MTKVLYPFGPADALALSATGAQALTIDNRLTIVDGVSVVATGNRTLNLTIDSKLEAGARLFVKSKTTGTETLIPGTGMVGATTTGVAGKTFCTEFMYDGVSFKQIAAAVQID